LVLMMASGILSATAFIVDSVPILIGSMIVAPLLSPTALVSIGIGLGDWQKAARGLLTSIAGLIVAIAAAVLTVHLLNWFEVIPSEMNVVRKSLLEERVRPGWYSIIVGAVAGTSGLLGVVHEKLDTLIGSITSLALVPAGAAGAIALASGAPDRAVGGMLLLGVSYLMIIATGTITVLVMRRFVETRFGNQFRAAAENV
jgi:uncharacterized membrane protein